MEEKNGKRYFANISFDISQITPVSCFTDTRGVAFLTNKGLQSWTLMLSGPVLAYNSECSFRREKVFVNWQSGVKLP